MLMSIASFQSGAQQVISSREYQRINADVSTGSIVKTFDIHLQRTSKDKAVAIGLHPGTVKTQFSKEFWEGVQK